MPVGTLIEGQSLVAEVVDIYQAGMSGRQLEYFTVGQGFVNRALLDERVKDVSFGGEYEYLGLGAMTCVEGAIVGGQYQVIEIVEKNGDRGGPLEKIEGFRKGLAEGATMAQEVANQAQNDLRIYLGVALHRRKGPPEGVIVDNDAVVNANGSRVEHWLIIEVIVLCAGGYQARVADDCGIVIECWASV